MLDGVVTGFLDILEQLPGANLSRMPIERTLPRAGGHRPKLTVAQSQCLLDISSSSHHTNLAPGIEKVAQAIPAIGDDRCSASRSLKESSRRTPSIPRHL